MAATRGVASTREARGPSSLNNASFPGLERVVVRQKQKLSVEARRWETAESSALDVSRLAPGEVTEELVGGEICVCVYVCV